MDLRLNERSVRLADLPLCEARLQTDARFPWIVLIPRRPDLREIEDLGPHDQARLMMEIVVAGRAVRAAGQALGQPVEKLNLGQLGNIVPQLHLHVVGRRADDVAWPGPVWGFGTAKPYDERELEAAVEAAKAVLLQSRY